MAPSTDQLLRRQISEAFKRSSEHLDRQVAEALASTGQFVYSFDSQELAVVFANILHTLVDLQKFAGLTVPLVHNVASIEVEMRYPKIAVSLVLHIHSPIKAFIIIDYVLVPAPGRPSALTLERHSLCVEERTARFDFVAKTALATINIEGLVERELHDPAHAIRLTLPHRLSAYGFTGQIGQVRIDLTPENRLNTTLTASYEGLVTGE